MICPEAIPKVTKWLHHHPEGASPRMMVPRGQPDFAGERNLQWFNNIAGSAANFIEATGNCGEVYLLHPLMLLTLGLEKSASKSAHHYESACLVSINLLFQRRRR